MKRTVPGIITALLVMPLMISAYTAAEALPAATRPEAVEAKNAVAQKSAITLTVLSPQGAVKKGRDLAPRLGTLEGKKVAMWLSATRDHLYAGKGAELYDLLAKMLKEKFANITIVPYSDLPMKFAPEKEVVEAITATKPDAVVAGFGG